MIRVNLLGTDVAGQRDDRYRWALLALLGSAAVGLVVGTDWAAAADIAALESEITHLRRGAEAAEARLADEAQRDAEEAAFAAAVAELRRAPLEIAALVTRLEDFASALPDDVWCQSLEVSETHLSASGVASHASAIMSLLDRLVHSPNGQSAEFTSAMEPETSGEIPFSLRLSPQANAS